MNLPADDHARNARNLTLIVYGLQLASILIVLTAIVGVAINHVKSRDVADTIYASHFSWQIRTFWWSVLWFVIGGLLIPLFGIGIAIVTLASIWYIYRAVRGMLHWQHHDPMPVR